MHYVYILRSIKKGTYYIGQTNDLLRRVQEHNMGKSKSTKIGLPWELVYSKEYKSRSDAVRTEKKLKKCKKRIYIEKFINNQI